MRKYLAPTAAVIIGFLFLGPLGSILGVVIWYLVSNHKTT